MDSHPGRIKTLNLITKQFTDYRHSDSTNSMSENNAIEVKESPDGGESGSLPKRTEYF